MAGRWPWGELRRSGGAGCFRGRGCSTDCPRQPAESARPRDGPGSPSMAGCGLSEDTFFSSFFYNYGSSWETPSNQDLKETDNNLGSMWNSASVSWEPPLCQVLCCSLWEDVKAFLLSRYFWSTPGIQEGCIKLHHHHSNSSGQHFFMASQD
ncbi:unnamed protein product [Rangifer tarandus platyrhynchus]|uniref:Uncharacterized protein n=1 Tax=Rangifer tarandus platyrhynchus TaxID=3082113 RepID=A0ABN8YAE8_RANTA|nr:unnamed protein product [Rangifer tarandus platyrhynchus]